jgi:hypothetical protein
VRADADLHAVGGEHVERALGDRDLAERRRMHGVGHHEVARGEPAQVEHERPVLGGGALDGRVRLLYAGARARAAEVERDHAGEHAVAALAQERERRAQVALVRRRVPVERAHVETPFHRQLVPSRTDARPHAHGDRNLERRSLHALRRAARRRSPGHAAAPGRAPPHGHHRRRLRRR